MRKLLCALTVIFAMAGLVIAAEVTVVKYDADKKELTVKDGDKEVPYKLSGKEKITSTDKDGNATDVKFEDFEARLKKAGDKIGKMKLDITVEKDSITEIKYKKGKKN
jgi:hypothetical protein